MPNPEDEKCDVYVFHNGTEYETYVSFREKDPDYVGPPPLPLDQLAGKSTEFIQAEMDKGLRDLPNPHRGENFRHSTAQACIDNLLSLQSDGVAVSSIGMKNLRQDALKEADGFVRTRRGWERNADSKNVRDIG